MFDNNNNEEEVEFEEGDPTEEDILLYSTYPGLRLFILNDIEKTNIWGVLLEESDDSFLVGLPARIFPEEGNKFKVESLGPVPYTRIQKSAIFSTSYTFEPFETLYMAYLETKGKELYPEVTEYIEEGADIEAEPAEATISAADIQTISLTQDAAEGQEVLGMTDEELKRYLLDKYNNGELAGGSRKKQ